MHTHMHKYCILPTVALHRRSTKAYTVGVSVEENPYNHAHLFGPWSTLRDVVVVLGIF